MSGAPFLTPAQVGEELQCSHDTVLRAIKAGDLVAVRYGRTTRISRIELDAFLTRQRTDAPRAALALRARRTA